MKLKGAEIIIRVLEKMGIGIIAGIPGGSNLPIYDALYSSRIRHILVRHEQAAGFVAEGIARSTGKPAVCFATSGPGVTNLLTALADAKLDSIPVIAVTGQVAIPHLGTDAFQEVDAYGLSIPITKHNFQVRSVNDIAEIMFEAFRIAGTGRPGPVLVDVPRDIQIEETEWDEAKHPDVKINKPVIDESKIDMAARMIKESKKPLIYAGGGAAHAGGANKLKAFARKNSLPVAATLMGLGTFPCSDPLYTGMPGMHGHPYANHAMERADLVLACGVRFDGRATGKISGFCRNAKVIHIDIDDSEIDKIKKSDLDICGDIGEILSRLSPLVPVFERPEWLQEISLLKKDHPMPQPDRKDLLHPVNLILKTGSIAPVNTIITTDVGQHQMWVAGSYPFNEPGTFLTSGGLGTMGFGLPAAIGACLANPGRKVICFTGDGSLLMNVQELSTLSESGLNVTVIVMNNGRLGLVRQQQDLFFQKRFIASEFKERHDFKAIGEAFGIKSFSLENSNDPYGILREAIDLPHPALIDVPVSPDIYALPMVRPGSANLDMIGG